MLDNLKVNTVKVAYWKDLPSKKFTKVVFRLQHKIYKASKNKYYKLVNKLQRLLFKSSAVKFLAIQQVIQLNLGKKKQLVWIELKN